MADARPGICRHSGHEPIKTAKPEKNKRARVGGRRLEGSRVPARSVARGDLTSHFRFRRRRSDAHFAFSAGSDRMNEAMTGAIASSSIDLAVDGGAKRFGGVVASAGVSMSVPKGKIVVLGLVST